jgi:hypothetical protein
MNGNRRRISLVLLGLCMIAIGAISWQMWHGLSNEAIATYGERVVQPEVFDLCPGEALKFTQHIHVSETAAIDISRDWCVRDGVCSLELHEFWPGVILTPLEFEGPVSRIVPVSPLFKAGGEYEMRSGTQNGKLDVLIVPFSIRVDCPAP